MPDLRLFVSWNYSNVRALEDEKEGRQRPLSGVSHAPVRFSRPADENAGTMLPSDVTSLISGFVEL